MASSYGVFGHCWCTFLAVVLTISPTATAAVDIDPASDHAITLTVKRGLTGKLTFSHPSPTLRAVPDQSLDAAVLVRLERSAAIASTPDPGLPSNRQPSVDHDHHYTLWFFGTIAGDYDLSQWVVQPDGSRLSTDDALPPMIVRVVSELPPGHGTSLYEIDDPVVRIPGGYRAALVSFTLLWAVVPVIWLVIRWWTRRPMPATPIVLTPTLSDRLRPLVQRARDGLLTVDDQSRLEMLLYVFWQRRLGLPDSMADALPILRRDADAGGLLRTLESWIHADAPSRRSLDPSMIDALLAPYQAIEEIDSSVTVADDSGGLA